MLPASLRPSEVSLLVDRILSLRLLLLSQDQRNITAELDA